jgi:hypothetical protein
MADVEEVSPGLLRLYGVWHCHDVFCELHSDASIELHSMMQNSHFRHASVNGLTVLPENLITQ